MYADRREAGIRLGSVLREQTPKEALILSIPRGGVVIGCEVVRLLGCELDIVVPRKIGAPGEPELAIGAVMHDGSAFLNGDVIRSMGVGEAYIEEEKRSQMAESLRRLRVYRGERVYPSLAGREVVIVDDGIATGATMIVAARWARKQGASKVVLAAPVGPRESVPALQREADSVILPMTPEPFYAIGQFYSAFEQVEDQEVVSLLGQAWMEFDSKKRAS